jgi:hypothetical protein
MVNVKDKTCEEDGCEKIPNYNIHGEKRARFCAEHRYQDMINVKSKKCEEGECEKQQPITFVERNLVFVQTIGHQIWSIRGIRNAKRTGVKGYHAMVG